MMQGDVWSTRFSVLLTPTGQIRRDTVHHVPNNLVVLNQNSILAASEQTARGS